MARLLGFDEGRMDRGAKIYALTQLPAIDQFEFAGHTHWSNGKPEGDPVELWPPEHVAIDERFMRGPEVRAKENVRGTWTHTGPERLLKVETVIPHQEGMPSRLQYPPGAGVEQWKLLAWLPATLVAELGPDDPYRPYH